MSAGNKYQYRTDGRTDGGTDTNNIERERETYRREEASVARGASWLHKGAKEGPTLATLAREEGKADRKAPAAAVFLPPPHMQMQD